MNFSLSILKAQYSVPSLDCLQEYVHMVVHIKILYVTVRPCKVNFLFLVWVNFWLRLQIKLTVKFFEWHTDLDYMYKILV